MGTQKFQNVSVMILNKKKCTSLTTGTHVPKLFFFFFNIDIYNLNLILITGTRRVLTVFKKNLSIYTEYIFFQGARKQI